VSTEPAVPTPIPRPVVPVGLATMIGLPTAGLAAAVGGVAALAGGDHSAATLVSIGSATVLVATWMAGRFAQACALLRDTPSPRQLALGHGVAPATGTAEGERPLHCVEHRIVICADPQHCRCEAVRRDA
jgi:hypothetical protein